MSENIRQEIKLPETDKLIVSSSPHLHSGENISKIMLYVIISLMPACAVGVYYFGFNAVKVLFYCTASSMIIEWICCKMAGRPSTLRDGSAAVTGILLAMNLNAGVPWWVCVIGSVMAIGLAKQLYGGLGYNPFNPALVARVGLLIGFPQIMTTWMAPQAHNFFALDTVTCATPLGLVKEGLTPDKLSQVTSSQSIVEYAIGNVGGCLGETSVFALLIGGLALIILKIIRWQVPVAYIGTVAIFTAIVHQVDPSATPSALFHLVTGGLFLGAFFMATDMVTSPMTGRGGFIFGVGCGIITCLIRIWGSYPEGVSFSILIMNSLTPLIDRYTCNRPFGFRPPEKKEEKINA